MIRYTYAISDVPGSFECSKQRSSWTKLPRVYIETAEQNDRYFAPKFTVKLGPSDTRPKMNLSFSKHPDELCRVVSTGNLKPRAFSILSLLRALRLLSRRISSFSFGRSHGVLNYTW